jgi:hypothetical protein
VRVEGCLKLLSNLGKSSAMGKRVLVVGGYEWEKVSGLGSPEEYRATVKGIPCAVKEVKVEGYPSKERTYGRKERRSEVI